MTTFTSTWNTAYEAVPADSEDANLGASRIRDFKVAFSESHRLDPPVITNGVPIVSVCDPGI